MKRTSLSVKKIEAINQPGRYLDGWGLYLQVEAAKKSRTLHKSWLLRYEQNGRERTMGLGSYRLLTLAEARERALELHRVIKAGIDPLEARRNEKTAAALAAAQTMTFAECADKYFAAHSPKWVPEWSDQLKTIMGEYVTPILGKLPVREIDTESAVETGRDEVRLEAGALDARKFDQLAAPIEAKHDAPWLRRCKGADGAEEVVVVDLERGVERPATSEEIRSGIEYRDYEHFIEGKAA